MSAAGDRRDDDLLGHVHRGPWSRPSRKVRDRVRRMPRGEMLEGVDAHSMPSYRPDDVRAASDSLAGGDEVVVTCPHDDADVTVSISPPDAEGRWRLSGRAWLLGAASGDVTLALVHEDHVLQTSTVADGEYFELEDVLPDGWHLEVHLPGGSSLRVDDPRT